ncbi:MAG: metalloregulator ArsR/SmtB family transcription factor [Anaerolineales bacterium]|jgi:DNA-binding transcriptional ArsR family regulator
MPTSQDELILTPDRTLVRVSLEPVINALESLFLLAKVEDLSGLDPWVVETAHSLSEQEDQQNKLVFDGLHHALTPSRSFSSFESYLSDLAATPPETLKERILSLYLDLPPCEDCETDDFLPTPSDDDILASEDIFIQYLKSRFSTSYINEPIERQAYHLLTAPKKLQSTIIDHLAYMWDKYYQHEWNRVRPMLEESVNAFQRVDLAGLDPVEAATFILGRPHDKLEDMLNNHAQVVFVPSAHTGPYMGRFGGYDGGLLWLIFGARLPEGTGLQSSVLSRSELLVRLNALTDDTRLHILSMVKNQGEMCAQDIIDQLGLSQSTASRHLRQLSASGFLNERRRDSAKCYQLNQDRVQALLNGLEAFLL